MSAKLAAAVTTGLSVAKTAELAGRGIAQVKRVTALHRARAAAANAASE